MKTKTNLKAGKTYTTKPGDTLSSIALQQYGNAYLWPRIYAYKNNKSIIGTDPDKILAGIRIELW